MDFQSFKTDTAKVSEGVWVQPFAGDARFLLAHSSNPKAEALRTDLARRFRSSISAGGQLANDAFREMACQVLSQTIVLNWEKVEDEGAPLQFSKETCYSLVRKYSVVRDRLLEEADRLGPYVVAADGDATKN